MMDRPGSPDSVYSDRWTLHPQRQYSEVQKRENREIVKKLLREFDIDETRNRYEAQNSVEYDIDPGEFGIDTSLSALRIRQNLQRLMGTDVVHLNDRRYTEKLRKRMLEEYEAKMDKKEKALEEAERQRLRRLMLEGIIPNAKGTKDHQHRKRSKKHKHAQKESNQTKKKGARSSIMHEDCPYHNVTDEQTDIDEAEDKRKKESIVTQVELDNTSGDSQSVISPQEEQEYSGGKSAQDNSQVSSSQPNEERYSDSEATVFTTDQSSYKGQPKRKFLKHESPLVCKLRNEETVEGLYRLAELLVIRSPRPAN